MKNKRLFIICLCFTVLLSSFSFLTVEANSTSFTDIKESDWFYDNLIFLSQKGVIPKQWGGTFKPYEDIKVDEFLKMTLIAYGYKIEDGSDYWAQPFIDKAKELNIFRYEETINYSIPINRFQAAQIIHEVLNLEIPDAKYKTGIFKDWDKFPKYSCWIFPKSVYINGIMDSYPDDTFRYEKTISRAKGCEILSKVIDKNRRVIPDFSKLTIEEFVECDNIENNDKIVIVNNFQQLLEAVEKKYIIEKITDEKVKKAYDKAKQIVSEITTEKMTDVEKELKLHNYLIDNCKYDYDTYEKINIDQDAYTPYGALIEGKAVCSGYAYSMKLLLNLTDIESLIISTENHAWNIVKIDKDYYHLDATWNDTGSGRDMEYFNLTDEELILKDFVREISLESGKYPKCNGYKYGQSYLFLRENNIDSNSIGKLKVKIQLNEPAKNYEEFEMYFAAERPDVEFYRYDFVNNRDFSKNYYKKKKIVTIPSDMDAIEFEVELPINPEFEGYYVTFNVNEGWKHTSWKSYMGKYYYSKKGVTEEWSDKSYVKLKKGSTEEITIKIDNDVLEEN